MRRGLLMNLALNGAGMIHDFELAMAGRTCESVARCIREGQFGLWQETGRINEAVACFANEQVGLGEAVGRMIEEENFPYRETSVLAAGYRFHVPVTVHVCLGQDIFHEHPRFSIFVRSRAMLLAKPTNPIHAIIFVRIKRFWSERSPTEEQVITPSDK